MSYAFREFYCQLNFYFHHSILSASDCVSTFHLITFDRSRCLISWREKLSRTLRCAKVRCHMHFENFTASSTFILITLFFLIACLHFRHAANKWLLRYSWSGPSRCTHDVYFFSRYSQFQLICSMNIEMIWLSILCSMFVLRFAYQE